jgi:beta-phosphoglucomutase-like phosphatase (HAD superfamily)
MNVPGRPQGEYRDAQHEGASVTGGVLPALLFDLDGTLIDSMPLHHRAWVAWHAQRGLAMDETGFFAATAGRSNEEILHDLFPNSSAAERTAMADAKEALYRGFAADTLELVPGAREYLVRCRARGHRLAVCTASTLPNMALAFARFGIDGWVDTVVSPADRAPAIGAEPAAALRGKPHPDIFLEAARRLGVAPRDCVVFEDAPLGIEAARRAGMRCVALTTSMPARAFPAASDLIAAVPDFRSLDAPDAWLRPLPVLPSEGPHDA